MYSIRHSRIQHGVGQGSFHSATVEASDDGGQFHRFDYVYDCGALTGSRPSPALERAYRRLDLAGRMKRARRSKSTKVIDAIVLSHFDQDHMNGAEVLARRYRVERIFVPYLSPEELALEVARQAGSLSAKRVRELHGVATGGGELWGAPVTRVEGGPPPPGVDRVDLADGRPTPKDEAGSAGTADVSEEPPSESPWSMDATVEPDGATVGAVLNHNSDVTLRAASSRLWQLRFWNHGVDAELVFYVLTRCACCCAP